MKTYLGDGVYADYISDGFGTVLVLTTEDGRSVTNTIHIDEPTWRSLMDFRADAEREGEQ